MCMSKHLAMNAPGGPPFIDYLLPDNYIFFIGKFNKVRERTSKLHFHQQPCILQHGLLLSVFIRFQGYTYDTAYLAEAIQPPILDIKFRELDPYWQRCDRFHIDVHLWGPSFHNEGFVVKVKNAFLCYLHSIFLINKPHKEQSFSDLDHLINDQACPNSSNKPLHDIIRGVCP